MGNGVNKNCDQAKVLMKAAADRGNREARLRLYEWRPEGAGSPAVLSEGNLILRRNPALP